MIKTKRNKRIIVALTFLINFSVCIILAIIDKLDPLKISSPHNISLFLTEAWVIIACGRALGDFFGWVSKKIEKIAFGEGKKLNEHVN